MKKLSAVMILLLIALAPCLARKVTTDQPTPKR